MGRVDWTGEWHQLAEHYRTLTDDELIAIARQRGDLTDVAQQALGTEILNRQLEIPGEESEGPKESLPDPESNPDSGYEKDRELVTIDTVFSLRDAQQLEALLNEDSIPFYMGKERATRSEDVKSDFTKGVPVGVMRVGWPYAVQAQKNYKPHDEPDSRDWQEWTDRLKPAPVFCPRCRSAKVVLESSRPDSSLRSATRFLWRCEACGKRWEDDGVVAEE